MQLESSIRHGAQYKSRIQVGPDVPVIGLSIFKAGLIALIKPGWQKAALTFVADRKADGGCVQNRHRLEAQRYVARHTDTLVCIELNVICKQAPAIVAWWATAVGGVVENESAFGVTVDLLSTSPRDDVTAFYFIAGFSQLKRSITQINSGIGAVYQ